MARRSTSSKTRASKRGLKLSGWLSASRRSTTSLPITEMLCLHSHQLSHDLLGEIARSPDAAGVALGLDAGHRDLHDVAARGKIAPGLLPSSPQIDAEHAASRHGPHHAPHSPGRRALLDPTRPAAPGLGKEQRGLALLQQVSHALEHVADVLSRA